MSGRLLFLLLVLVVGFWGTARAGISAQNSSPLKLSAPAIPDPQQGQSAPVTLVPPPGAGTLHDIRGPVELPDATAMLVWFGVGLAVVLIFGLLLFFWRRQKKGENQPDSHELALAELSRLRSMMNAEQALIYAEQLSELLRRYIEARFQIHSTRQTTREFFAGLSSNSQTLRSMEAYHDRLKECLEQCDMAKFAHCIPDQQGMEAMEQAVLGFIRATGPAVEEKGEG